MLENIDNVEDVIKIYGQLPIPSKKEVDVDNYISLFKENKHYKELQFYNLEDYDYLIKELISRYDDFILKVILESFYPFILNKTYIRYIEFLENLKIKYSSYIEEIKFLQNYLIDVYTYHFDQQLIELKNVVGEVDLQMFKKEFNVEPFSFDFRFFNGNGRNEAGEMEEALENGTPLIYDEYSQHLLYVTVFNYYAARNVAYRKVDKKILETSLNKLLKIKKEYFELIKNSRCFFPAIQRIYSLIASYHNINIKYIIDNKGKNNIKKYVDDYLDDMLFLDTVAKSLVVGEKKKCFLNYIEIINFYNMINVDTANIKTKNNKLNLNKFYYSLVLKTIYELNFDNKCQFYYRKKKLMCGIGANSNHTLSEIGMFISGLSLFNTTNNIQDDNFATYFAEFFEKYKKHNYGKPFKDFMKPIVSLDYIWRN